MRYTEIQEPLDAQDKMIFFKSFQKALIIAFIVGGVGFILLLFDFLYYNKFQALGWLVLVVPLSIFLISLGNFDQKLVKDKQIIMGTVIDKKNIVNSELKHHGNGDPYYVHTHKFHLFIEGKDKPIEVSEELFHFLQKQDTMKLHYMDEVLYKYEKNV